jgi:hypothetical protein
MASAERLLVSTCFIAYYRYLLVSHPTKLKMYAALQNESGVSSLTITAKGGGEQCPMVGETMNGIPGTLKNCDE